MLSLNHASLRPTQLNRGVLSQIIMLMPQKYVGKYLGNAFGCKCLQGCTQKKNVSLHSSSSSDPHLPYRQLVHDSTELLCPVLDTSSKMRQKMNDTTPPLYENKYMILLRGSAN